MKEKYIKVVSCLCVGNGHKEIVCAFPTEYEFISAETKESLKKAIMRNFTFRTEMYGKTEEEKNNILNSLISDLYDKLRCTVILSDIYIFDVAETILLEH